MAGTLRRGGTGASVVGNPCDFIGARRRFSVNGAWLIVSRLTAGKHVANSVSPGLPEPCTIGAHESRPASLALRGPDRGSFTLANHFAGAWWLAWLAPVPVLWLAFGQTNPMTVLATALGAAGLGAAALALPYLGVVPEPALGAAIALAAIGFAVCVMGARLAGRTVTPMAGALVFAALWTVWDFVAASGPDGTLFSPATSQAGIPILIQSAALAGAWTITFLLGAVAACLALAFRKRNALYVLPAVGLFTVNLAFGALHMQQTQGAEHHVVLIDSDALAEASAIDRRDIALGAVLAYAAEIRLRARGADLVVLPERIAVLRPAWRETAIAYLRAAAFGSGATIIAGFEMHDGRGARNIALIVAPGNGSVPDYVQASGASPAQGPAVAISHDLNYFAALRRRVAGERKGLMAVPAWDFGADATAEAHKAILRGVENGFAVARTARDGKLVLADALGRTVAQRRSEADGFTVLARDLREGPQPGRTPYDRIGDVFVWFCAGMAGAILLFGLLRMVLAATPARDMRARRPLPGRLSGLGGLATVRRQAVPARRVTPPKR